MEDYYIADNIYLSINQFNILTTGSRCHQKFIANLVRTISFLIDFFAVLVSCKYRFCLLISFWFNHIFIGTPLCEIYSYKPITIPLLVNIIEVKRFKTLNEGLRFTVKNNRMIMSIFIHHVNENEIIFNEIIQFLQDKCS